MLDERTTRHAGYQISQKKRKRIEECFGWLKTIALLPPSSHRRSRQHNGTYANMQSSSMGSGLNSMSLYNTGTSDAFLAMKVRDDFGSRADPDTRSDPQAACAVQEALRADPSVVADGHLVLVVALQNCAVAQIDVGA